MKKPICCAVITAFLLVMCAPAQSPALPQTYAFTATSNLSGPSTLTVNRNGSKELIEISATSGGFHLRVLYDFQAHRIHTQDLNTKTCTTQEYASAYAPSAWDPIGGAGEMLRESGSLRTVGRETLNGIAVRLVEAPFPDGKGKARMWLEEKFGFPVKQSFRMGNEPEKLLFELRQIKYAPSAATLFAAPEQCTRIGGVSTANGGSAEMNVDVSAQGQVSMGGSPAGIQAAKAGDSKRLIGKWSFTGKDVASVQWTGTLTVTELEPDNFDRGKYSNVCELSIQSEDSGKGAAGPCLYDPRTKTLSFTGGEGSSSYGYTAVLSADGKSLTQGRWTEGGSQKGAWTAATTSGR